ncbi:MAG TPA: cytochrome c [Candidatus Tyrphobacter sp.]
METSMRLAIVLALGTGLAACSHASQGNTTSSTTATQASAGVVSPAANASAPVNGTVASDGATVYETNCSSCHQASGQGMPGTFPPLAENPVVTGDPARVIHIVKDGLTGTIAVKGTNYSGSMPSWGQTLSGPDIAAAITYIRSSWGNSASAVTPAQVAATR